MSTVTGQTYAALEKKITKGETAALLARWEFGRKLLAEREANGGKQLPAGRMDEVCEEVGRAEREIRYRMKFAELCPDQGEVCKVLQTSCSWWQIITEFLTEKKAEHDTPVMDELLGGTPTEPLVRTVTINWVHGEPSEVLGPVNLDIVRPRGQTDPAGEDDPGGDDEQEADEQEADEDEPEQAALFPAQDTTPSAADEWHDGMVTEFYPKEIRVAFQQAACGLIRALNALRKVPADTRASYAGALAPCVAAWQELSGDPVDPDQREKRAAEILDHFGDQS
jgi:hypothetical protein